MNRQPPALPVSPPSSVPRPNVSVHVNESGPERQNARRPCVLRSIRLRNVRVLICAVQRAVLLLIADGACLYLSLADRFNQ